MLNMSRIFLYVLLSLVFVIPQHNTKRRIIAISGVIIDFVYSRFYISELLPTSPIWVHTVTGKLKKFKSLIRRTWEHFGIIMGFIKLTVIFCEPNSRRHFPESEKQHDILLTITPAPVVLLTNCCACCSRPLTSNIRTKVGANYLTFCLRNSGGHWGIVGPDGLTFRPLVTSICLLIQLAAHVTFSPAQELVTTPD